MMRPTSIAYSPIADPENDLLVDMSTIRNYIGLFDDRSLDELLLQIQQWAHTYVEQWLNKPVSGQTVTVWYEAWHGMHRVPAAWDRGAVVTAHYWDAADNVRKVMPANSVLLDPTRQGAIVTTPAAQSVNLSSLFSAPAEVSIAPTICPNQEAVKAAILKVCRRFYESGHDGAGDGSMRHLIGDLLGNSSFVSVS